MPADLLRAHQANDKVVLQAYGFNSSCTESEIVAKLFKLYQERIDELAQKKEEDKAKALAEAEAKKAESKAKRAEAAAKHKAETKAKRDEAKAKKQAEVKAREEADKKEKVSKSKKSALSPQRDKAIPKPEKLCTYLWWMEMVGSSLEVYKLERNGRYF